MTSNTPSVGTRGSTNMATPTLMNSTNTTPAWRPHTRSRPRMTRPGKITPTLATLFVAGLAFTSCSSEDEAAEPEQAHEVESLMATDARDDQRAAGGATMMAVELGFDQVQTASETDLAAVRDNAAERTDAAQELNVEPTTCAEP